MRRGLALCVVAAAVLASSPAFAQRHWASGEDDRYHRHEGLFMRFDAGLGYLSAGTSLNGSSGALSGAAGSFGFSLGANLVEDLSLFGHVGISFVSDPKNTLPSGLSTAGSTLAFAAVGPGLNYYFTPSNFYVSGMLLVTRLTITDSNNNVGTTQAGFGAKAAVGKEWWVSDHWGMGIAAQLTLGTNPDQDTGTGNTPTWTTVTPALAFSASFN